MKVQDPAAGGETFELPNELTDENPMVSKTFDLAHGKGYDVSLDFVKSQSWTVWFLPGEPLGTWYCWEAIAGGKPNSDVATFPYLEDEFYKLGARNDEVPYFSIGENGYWLADNTAGLLTPHRFQLDENRAGGLKAHLLPVEFIGGLGVDCLSNTVTGVVGSQSKYWIMAPAPDPIAPETPKNGTWAILKIPTSKPLTIDLACEQAPPAPASLEFDAGVSQMGDVFWSGSDAQKVSGDFIPKFQISKIGDAAVKSPIPIQLPLGVKVMKRRTVNVAVYPVKRSATSRNVPMPAVADLEAGLNNIYGKQINASFKIDLKPESVYEYAPASNRANLIPNITTMLASNDDAGHSIYLSGSPDIRVILIDGASLYEGANDTELLNGATLPKTGISVVLTGYAEAQDSVSNPYTEPTDRTIRTKQAVIETVAHEVGHVMNLGHPDEDKDPAPLQKLGENGKREGLSIRDQTRRLMCSGRLRHSGSGAILLVKGEWDEAEKWLKARPNGDR